MMTMVQIETSADPPQQLGRLIQTCAARLVQWAKNNAKLSDMG